MAEEGGHLLHPRKLASGGAKTVGLVNSSGSDEGLVVPEPGGVGHRGVPLWEKILKLVRLEEVRDGLIATVFGQTFALPTLVTNLLSLHYLYQWRRLGIAIGNTHRSHCHCHCHYQNPPFVLHFYLQQHKRKPMLLGPWWFGEKWEMMRNITSSSFCIRCSFFVWNLRKEKSEKLWEKLVFFLVWFCSEPKWEYFPIFPLLSSSSKLSLSEQWWENTRNWEKNTLIQPV